jgi:DNA-binding NtrC family response regulator
VTPSGLLHPGFSIDRLEKELIMESLARSSGNKTEAAKLLGITRRRLYSRLKSIENDNESEDNPAESTDGIKPKQ